MNKSKKILCLILCLLMLSLSACGDNGEKNNAETSQDTTTQTVETEISKSDAELRSEINDNLPEKDFGGKEFRIATKVGNLYEISTEEEDGEMINDALYKRNLTIEERFDVKIVPVITNDDSGSAQVNAVQKAIQAGEDAFDLAATYVFKSGPLVTDGLYYNWLDIPNVDFSRPWWMSGINDKFKVHDAIYAAVGDMCLSTLKLTYGVFYNKRLAQDYSLPDLYEKVRTGEWTIDYFISLVRDIYSDLNGDGLFDPEDKYGFTAEAATNLDVYPFAFDIPIINTAEDGTPKLVFNTEKTIHSIEKINELYWGGTGSYIATSDVGMPVQMFKNGNALFTTTWLEKTFSTFRDMTDDYGILPYPKYDDKQEKYLTGAMDNYSVLGVPKTVKDVELVGIITEALNAESYKQLYPVYYEEALQNKYARDEGTIEMLNILMSGRNFDFCTLFSSNISGMPWLFRELVASKSTSFSSAYEKNSKSAQAGLDKVIEAYEKHS